MLHPAVYRPQGLNFVDQAEALKYARDLGVPNAYLQPVLEAYSHRKAENRHGYDQIDHECFASGLGGALELERLIDSIHENGGEVVVDWVPNHHFVDPQLPSHRLSREDPSVYDSWIDAGGRSHTANFFGLWYLLKVRLEDPCVFEKTQGYFLNWAAKNHCALRGDHWDGWQNPHGVVSELRDRGVPLIAEHTASQDEVFITDNHLLGETGYRTMDWLNRLINRSEGIEAITEEWRRWVDEDTAFRQVVPGQTAKEVLQRAKYEAAFISFAPDMERLRMDLCKAGYPEVTSHDIATWSSRMEEIRTYCWRGQQPARWDINALHAMQAPEWFVQYIAAGNSPFWQPVMAGINAKGSEDRFLYRWTPVLSLNEVGGTILPPSQFHEYVQAWSDAHPNSWTALDTHDTKRSSAVRASLAAATQKPEQHAETMLKLRDISVEYNRNGLIGPHALRFIFDTMLGAWPCTVDRLVPYFIKAFREAAINTGWLSSNHNQEWEDNLERFVRNIVEDEGFERVLFTRAYEMDMEGRQLLLSQYLLGLMIPGPFAFYNGAEGPNNKWLVDPDNRRLTDYTQLSGYLQNVRDGHLCHENRLMSLIYRTLQAQQVTGSTLALSPWEPLDAPQGCMAVRRRCSVTGDLIAVVSLDPWAKKGAHWSPCRNAHDLLPEFERQGLYHCAPRNY